MKLALSKIPGGILIYYEFHIDRWEDYNAIKYHSVDVNPLGLGLGLRLDIDIDIIPCSNPKHFRWLLGDESDGHLCHKFLLTFLVIHDDIIKFKYFPHYWHFVTGEFPLQRSVTRSFDVFWTNNRVNNRDAGDSRRHRAHYESLIVCRS